LIISLSVHLLEGLVPPNPCFGSRPNDQLSLLNNEIDCSVQLALLNDGFGNPNPPGISNSHDMGLHLFFLTIDDVYMV
jgi:hypothetical protein